MVQVCLSAIANRILSAYSTIPKNCNVLLMFQIEVDVDILVKRTHDLPLQR